MDPTSNIVPEYDHGASGLRRRDLDPDPIKQFSNWFTAAVEAGIRNANAMSLATASATGRPFVRIVLLKGFDHDGFVFFTNYESQKGQQLAENPHAALAFYWVQLDRQIRINGSVERCSRQESERYFHSRPPASQLSAWASPQSRGIDGRRVLEAKVGPDDGTICRGPDSSASSLGRICRSPGDDRILAGAPKPAARSGFATVAIAREPGTLSASRRRIFQRSAIVPPRLRGAGG